MTYFYSRISYARINRTGTRGNTRLCTCTCTLRSHRGNTGEKEEEREKVRETRTSTRLYSHSLLLTWRACRSIRTCDYQADPHCVFATEMERHSLQHAIVYAYVFRKSSAQCSMSRKFCANYFNHRAHRAFLIIGPGSGLSGIVKKIQPDADSSYPLFNGKFIDQSGIHISGGKGKNFIGRW